MMPSKKLVVVIATHLLAAALGIFAGRQMNARTSASVEGTLGDIRHYAASTAVDLTYRFGRAEQARAFMAAIGGAGDMKEAQTRGEVVRSLRLAQLCREVGDGEAGAKYLKQARDICLRTTTRSCSEDDMERAMEKLGRRRTP